MPEAQPGGGAAFWCSAPRGSATRVLLVRHGRVAWNARAAFTGWTDIPLDERGEWEVEQLADRLDPAPIAAVYSSDLVRAHRSAAIIASRHGLSAVADPDLREINYGEWEGLGESDIVSRYGRDVFRGWKADPENVPIPGGETFGQLRDRAAPAVDRLVAQHPGQTIVVAAHKSVNRTLICHWLDMPVGRYKTIEQDNVATNSILFDGNRVVVESVNDVCHLRGKRWDAGR